MNDKDPMGLNCRCSICGNLTDDRESSETIYFCGIAANIVPIINRFHDSHKPMAFCKDCHNRIQTALEIATGSVMFDHAIELEHAINNVKVSESFDNLMIEQDNLKLRLMSEANKLEVESNESENQKEET
jgi:hypothetical protein